MIWMLKSVACVDQLRMSVESSPVLGHATMETENSLRTSNVTVSGAVPLRVAHAREKRIVSVNLRIMCVEWVMAISTTPIHLLLIAMAPNLLDFCF